MSVFVNFPWEPTHCSAMLALLASLEHLSCSQVHATSALSFTAQWLCKVVAAFKC